MDHVNKPRLWVRFRHWLSTHRKFVWIVSIILVLSTIGIIAYAITHQKTVKTTPKTVSKTVVSKPKSAPAVKFYSPLTGNLVTNEAATKQPVTAIMIENSPNARPQSGLKNSGVVFEAIAEGGITRFLVLYQQEKPQLIGPVRSLRLYDVDWLAAFDTSIGHVGGSAAALVEIRNGTYRDIDQFFSPDNYWRSTDRYAPHNVYTSFELLDALNVAKGYTTSTFTGFTRVNGKASKTPNATTVNITISGFYYDSSYIYDSVTNTYARSQAGEPHLDRESGQIAPSVVIAMRVDETSIYEDGWRESITTIGSGAAVIFQNGVATNATWTKASKLGQVTFADAAGKDIPLVRGQTWIIAVPNSGGDVTWL